MTKQHQGAKVVVTGGTSGIGNALATAYAADGADVTVTGRKASASDYALDLSQFTYLQLDVEDDASIDAACASIDACDVLINNAGTSMMSMGLDEWEPDVFARAVNMHLISGYRMAKNLKPLLSKSARTGGGVITSIGSMSSLLGIEAVPGYGAGKTGMLGITRAIAVAWGRENIRANVLALGLIETPMTEMALQYPELLQPYLSRTPLGRIGQVSDATGPALFLSSPAALYITGQVLVVDGGFSIQG